MDQLVCNYCWSIIKETGCRLICNHIHCEQCSIANRGPRGIICPSCSELTGDDDMIWFQVIGRQISESELKDLKASLLTVACANGVKFLGKFAEEMYDLDHNQLQGKLSEFVEKKNYTANFKFLS